MPLDIEVSRPFSLLLIVGVTFVSFSALTGNPEIDATVTEGQGGDTPPQIAIHTAEDEVKRARLERELAVRHIEVLKYQLHTLEEERSRMQPDLSDELDEEFRKGLRQLLDLIEGKRRADDKMVASFQQMWEANRAGLAAAALSDDDPAINISWPIEPTYGISAIFQDPEYKQYFGLEHNAIDIPALQGTTVAAAQEGVVEEVIDNGLGYSYISIRHEGYVTLYGHMSDMFVAPGQVIGKGEAIGLSGGMPGTKGAGNLTTGPHLHFELITGKGHINPLKYLPASGVKLRD